MIRIGVVVAASILATSLYASEMSTDTGVPVSMLVTVQGHRNAQAPRVTPDDVLVSQNKQHMQVTALEPLHDLNGLQLWILIDDGSETDLGVHLADLRRFVLAQPPATQIGIGYLRNGSAVAVQPLTADHEMAAKAMRLPTGPAGISASPYLALSELIHKWPAGSAAREVLMVSSGIDPDYGTGPDNPYLDEAVRAAQRAGVVVYSIYYPGAGRLGQAGRQVFWGQNYLAQLSEQTGGELYWLGAATPVSLVPYLDDVSRRLNGQYLLTFLAKPDNKPGFQNVEIRSELPQVKLTGPSQVYVPAGK
jgi:hypothetical protein